jgi:hypothetical protein
VRRGQDDARAVAKAVAILLGEIIDAAFTNSAALGAFREEITARWLKTLRRRSQKSALTWAAKAGVCTGASLSNVDGFCGVGPPSHVTPICDGVSQMLAVGRGWTVFQRLGVPEVAQDIDAVDPGNRALAKNGVVGLESVPAEEEAAAGGGIKNLQCATDQRGVDRPRAIVGGAIVRD